MILRKLAGGNFNLQAAARTSWIICLKLNAKHYFIFFFNMLDLNFSLLKSLFNTSKKSEEIFYHTFMKTHKVQIFILTWKYDEFFLLKRAENSKAAFTRIANYMVLSQTPLCFFVNSYMNYGSIKNECCTWHSPNNGFIFGEYDFDVNFYYEKFYEKCSVK